MTLKQTPFLLSTLGLLLVVGPAEQIIEYVDQEIGNKQAIVAANIRRDGKMAAVIHITNDYEGDLVEATRQEIPTQLIEQIVGGLGKDWTGLHYLAALEDGVKNAMGGQYFKGNQALTDFARKLFDACFTKDGFVAGSRNQNELLLIGPEGKRRNFVWKQGFEVKMLPAPFGKGVPMRNTTIGKDAIIAVERYTGKIVQMTAAQVNEYIEDGTMPDWKLVVDLENTKIDDISTAYQTAQGTYTVLATGQFDQKDAIALFTVQKNGEDFGWTIAAPIELDEDTSGFGSIVRFTPFEVAMVRKDDGDLGTLTRFPLDRAPAQVQQAVMDALSA